MRPPPGPIVAKALVSLVYAVRYNASEFQDEAMTLDLADGGRVSIRHPGLNSIVISFKVRLVVTCLVMR